MYDENAYCVESNFNLNEVNIEKFHIVYCYITEIELLQAIN